MFSVQLSGELDVNAAATLAATLSAALAVVPEIDVDLTPRHPMGAQLPFWVIRWTGGGSLYKERVRRRAA